MLSSRWCDIVHGCVNSACQGTQFIALAIIGTYYILIADYLLGIDISESKIDKAAI